MAYIIQHRRDTLENWVKVNPVLADAEIGFILAPGTSMYKIGDGVTAWNDLPLFGFGGNFYDNFEGSDLDQSVPSRRVVLESLQELTHGSEKMEGVLNKLSVKQLVQLVTPDADTEEFEGVVIDKDHPLPLNQLAPILKNQIASRWAVLNEFQRVWNDLTALEESHIKLSDEDVKALKDFAEKYGPIVDGNVDEIELINTTLEEHTATLEEHTATLEEHTTYIDANTKYITGFDEVVDTEETDPETGEPITETIHHKGIDERFEDVSTSISEVDKKVDSLTNDINAKHQILSEEQYADIKDFSSYPEGTLFFTYKNQ